MGIFLNRIYSYNKLLNALYSVHSRSINNSKLVQKKRLEYILCLVKSQCVKNLVKMNEFVFKYNTYSLFILRKNICFPSFITVGNITLCYAGKKRTAISTEYRNKIIKDRRKKPFFCYTFFCETRAYRMCIRHRAQNTFRNLFWLHFFYQWSPSSAIKSVSTNFIKQIFFTNSRFQA